MIAFRTNEKVAVFVDGSSVYGCAKGLEFDIDYLKFLKVFQGGALVRAVYYTVMAETDDFSPIRPLIDFLEYNGFIVSTKPGKEYQDSQGKKRLRGSMNVDIAIDALGLVDRVDHIVIVSGDSDLIPLVEALQRKGCRVTVISTIKTEPAVCSDELRRAADAFIDFIEIKPAIARIGANAKRVLHDTGAQNGNG